MIQKSKQTVLIGTSEGIPWFQTEDCRGVILNLRLDVEIDGVTYHLTSEFSGKSELGEVIDTIELERNQRMTA
jgi:hypothetical protein